MAVAAGMCDWAIGTDTGGSIRVPAALCGVVGIKPTLGSISTEGVLPLSRTLDTLGPIATDVATAAGALETMGMRRETLRIAPRKFTNYSLAIPAGWVVELDETVASAWYQLTLLLPEIEFPDRALMARSARTILDVEASAVHRAWLAQHSASYGADVRELLSDGMSVTGVDYLVAQEERLRLIEEVAQAMQGVDAVVVPTTAIVAPKIGESGVREGLTRFTRPFNATGQPVVSVPVRSKGLPVGISVVGHMGRDWDLIQVAKAFEERWGKAA